MNKTFFSSFQLSVEELKENYEKEKEKLKEMAGEEQMETDNVQKGWYMIFQDLSTEVSVLYLVQHIRENRNNFYHSTLCLSLKLIKLLFMA